MIAETRISMETFPRNSGLYFRQEKSFRDHALIMPWLTVRLADHEYLPLLKYHTYHASR